jgi:OOP family OmpA-OmpF porin
MKPKNHTAMKISYLAIVILAGMICSNNVSAKPHRHARKTRHTGHTVAIHTDLAAKKVNNIEFAFNKQQVAARYYPELDNIAKLMMQNKASLKLSGYADNRGGYVYNWKLSEKRALAVRQYLGNKGVDTSRVAVTEFGYTHPVASNKTAAGRKRNRRVEIRFAD